MTRYHVTEVGPDWLLVLRALTLLALAIIAGRLFWQETTEPGFRRACTAEGGVVVQLEGGGRACLWAGAFIPITSGGAAVYSSRPPGEPTDRSPDR